MKYLDEYRDPALARRLLAELGTVATRPWRLMEVCGGQTHTLVRQGIDELLPAGIRMIHGPGCPVCVTPVEVIDRALELAATPGVVFTSFGDMLRVPGTTTSLLQIKAAGGDVRVVYSPADAVRIAAAEPERQVVFLAVGFETTAPANAAAVLLAEALGLENFSMLVSHVLVPPAVTAILEDPDCLIDGFLAAGHVCAVMGFTEYEPIAARYRVPLVVTGFEPLDLLEGILMTVRQLEAGRHEVENQYARAVRRDGNQSAQDTIRRVFRVADKQWRGIGSIPDSGLVLAPAYERFDAAARFPAAARGPEPASECIAGQILTGLKVPTDCPAYGTRCTPRHPLGAPMVSSEGTCAAFHSAGRTAVPVSVQLSASASAPAPVSASASAAASAPVSAAASARVPSPAPVSVSASAPAPVSVSASAPAPAPAPASGSTAAAKGQPS